MTTGFLLFGVGDELFAASLPSVDEAVDLGEVHRIAPTSEHGHGVFLLRGRLVPLVSATHALGVAPRTGDVALVAPAPGGRVGIVIDDVHDVLMAEPQDIRPNPAGDGRDGGVLRGMIRRGHDLVTVVSIAALVASCRPVPQPEVA